MKCPFDQRGPQLLQRPGCISEVVDRECLREDCELWVEVLTRPGADKPGCCALTALAIGVITLHVRSPRTCVDCGCEDMNACTDPDTGMPCTWVRTEDLPEGVKGPLCSVCLKRRQRAGEEQLDGGAD